MPESVSVTLQAHSYAPRLSMEQIKEAAISIAQEIRLRWLEPQRWEDDGGPCV